jgi:hypothetical protein
VDIMNWFDSLPAADATVPCGSGTHTVRWQTGQLTLPSHPDAEAELVLGALGGDTPACVTVAETWARHAADLAILAAGPRCAADQVSIGWEEVERQRADLPQGLLQAIAVTRHRSASGPGASGAPGVPGTPRPGQVRGRPRGPGGSSGPGGPGSPFGPGRLPSALAPGMAENVRRIERRLEVTELLALGPALQFRLSGAVCAAWAEPDRANERAALRPQFAAALTGRFAPAAQEWLGINPDAVTVTPHEGPGWGAIELTGADQDRRLRAALPVGWLASVWACGLAVVDGHLVVAVEAPGYPEARVLALPAPDAEPVTITVHATAADPAGLPTWEIDDLGRERRGRIVINRT